MENSFNTSVFKYGGYYVGRYEAGVGATSGNTAGVPVCKQGVNVWRNISRNNAASSAQKMYENSEELKSSLMSSYAYDTMLNWIKSNNYNVANDSSAWGNYKNSSNGSIQVAGNNTRWKANNIYDVAGNVWEWTTENYGNDAVVRGGDALSYGSILPAGTRDHASPSSTFDYTGFRVLLYRDSDYKEKATALAIAAGSHTAYIDSDNQLWMWGKNTKGQLGNGSTISPVIKPSSMNTTIKFKEISCSRHISPDGVSNFSIGISTEGYLYTWGSNSSGQLGNGKSGSGSSYYVLTPQEIKVNDNNGNRVEFQKVSAGNTHCLALDKSGNIWVWGSNTSYMTGLGSASNIPTKVPTMIKSDYKFKEISAGFSHSVALSTDSKLYTWGNGQNYRLGTTSNTNIKTPTLVNTGTMTFKKISAGYSQTFAIDINGHLWACGSASYGSLGNNNSTTSLKPFQQITSITTTFDDISSNYYNTLAIDTNKYLWGWGSNTNGQLGNNKSGDSEKEMKPISILAGIKIKKIAMGFKFFIAVTENEDVYTCGYNNYGELGNNSTEDKHVPISITISK